MCVVIIRLIYCYIEISLPSTALKLLTNVSRSVTELVRRVDLIALAERVVSGGVVYSLPSQQPSTSLTNKRQTQTELWGISGCIIT